MQANPEEKMYQASKGAHKLLDEGKMPSKIPAFWCFQPNCIPGVYATGTEPSARYILFDPYI